LETNPPSYAPSFAQCRDQATTPDRISKTQFKEPRNAPWERLLFADFGGRVGFKFEKIMSHVCIEKGCLRIFQSMVLFKVFDKDTKPLYSDKTTIPKHHPLQDTNPKDPGMS